VNFVESKLSGCVLIDINVSHDPRGTFKKIYHSDEFQNYGLRVTIKEQFLTFSNKNVLRGMHFQLPPSSHSKLVTCINGSVLDVILDLRKNSQTYGQTDSFLLSSNLGKTLFLPAGIAHGFLSLENNSGMMYSTSEVHNPNLDCGVKWDSFGFSWPINNPIISSRDGKHQLFDKFVTPF
jgi:dTDP-4-dehydrorhamnose 3,5-epimerase